MPADAAGSSPGSGTAKHGEIYHPPQDSEVSRGIVLPTFSLKRPVFGTEAAEHPASTGQQPPRGSRSRSESFTRWAIAR